MDFKTQIADRRKYLGWSPERLSEEAGLARSYWRGIEAGAFEPSLGTLRKVACVLRRMGHPIEPEGIEAFIGACPAAPGGAADERGAGE